MSDALATYRGLEAQLIRLRWLHAGAESPEEDALLDRMDRVWWQLTEAERSLLDAEGARTLIRDAPLPPSGLRDHDVWTWPTEPPRGKKVA